MLRLGHDRDGWLPGMRDAGLKRTLGLRVLKLWQSRDG